MSRTKCYSGCNFARSMTLYQIYNTCIVISKCHFYLRCGQTCLVSPFVSDVMEGIWYEGHNCREEVGPRPPANIVSPLWRVLWRRLPCQEWSSVSTTWRYMVVSFKFIPSVAFSLIHWRRNKMTHITAGASVILDKTQFFISIWKRCCLRIWRTVYHNLLSERRDTITWKAAVI